MKSTFENDGIKIEITKREDGDYSIRITSSKSSKLHIWSHQFGVSKPSIVNVFHPKSGNASITVWSDKYPELDHII